MSLLTHKTPPSFLHTLHHRFRNSHKYHHRRTSIYSYRFPPTLTVSSSLFASANAIVAASGSSGSAVHGAVTSAITQVAVTAVAIASGACLSTKVDFLWPKLQEEQPGLLSLKHFLFVFVFGFGFGCLSSQIDWNRLQKLLSETKYYYFF